MTETLKKKFFERPTVTVAKDLLGKYLCRKYRGKVIRAMITEVEAYDGFEDRASHAHRGMTEGNKVMFGPAGHWYVYLTYGIHWMLNVVTGKEEYPAAVLIRGVEEVNGPGRLTKFMRIDKKFNGKRANRLAGLWIEDNPGLKGKRLKIKSSPRVGVDSAGSVWVRKHYRFYID